MKHGIGAIVVVFLMSAMPLAFVGGAVASAAPALEGSSMAFLHSGPRAALLNSTNWAGYAVTGANNSVKFVNASWIQPTVTCPSTATIYLDAFWVGIDGFSSPTVEQTGTLVECIAGVPYYYAWYEFYPSPLTVYTLTVNPGDTFHATVTFVNATVGFRTTVTDVTTGKGAAHTQTASTAQRNSAEWIAEAPSGSAGIYALGNFGVVHFGKDATGIGVTNDATIHGLTRAIGGFARSTIHRIDMITTSGSKLKALTSLLTPDGTSFNVTWKRAGP